MFPPDYFGPTQSPADPATIAAAVWTAGSRTVTGASSPLPTTFSGAGRYALSQDGGVGAGAAAMTVGGAAAGTDRLRVLDANGNPIASATIRLYLASDSTFTNLLGAATTGPDGRWLGPIYCDSGSYQVVIASTAGQSVVEQIEVP